MGIYIKGATLSVELKEIFKELDIMDNLIEVKTPHGRLIDADELWEHIGRDRLDSRELIMKMVDKAPTVIEAEVE